MKDSLNWQNICWNRLTMEQDTVFQHTDFERKSRHEFEAKMCWLCKLFDALLSLLLKHRNRQMYSIDRHYWSISTLIMISLLNDIFCCTWWEKYFRSIDKRAFNGIISVHNQLFDLFPFVIHHWLETRQEVVLIHFAFVRSTMSMNMSVSNESISVETAILSIAINCRSNHFPIKKKTNIWEN